MSPPRNLPNLITAFRLLLAVLLFAVLGLVHCGRGVAVAPGSIAAWAQGAERLLFNVSLAIFLLAAFSDVADGYVARRWGLTTDFGRIVDPFADKVVVCGAFVMLIPIEEARVGAWMVVLILARELLVDGLRGFAESRGVAFPASAAGKAKMLTQSVCLAWLLGTLANFRGQPWAEGIGQALLWTTVLVTVASGAVYVARARRLLHPASTARATPPGGNA